MPANQNRSYRYSIIYASQSEKVLHILHYTRQPIRTDSEGIVCISDWLPEYGALLVLAAGSVLDLLLDGAAEKALQSEQNKISKQN